MLGLGCCLKKYIYFCKNDVLRHLPDATCKWAESLMVSGYYLEESMEVPLDLTMGKLYDITVVQSQPAHIDTYTYLDSMPKPVYRSQNMPHRTEDDMYGSEMEDCSSSSSFQEDESELESYCKNPTIINCFIQEKEDIKRELKDFRLELIYSTVDNQILTKPRNIILSNSNPEIDNTRNVLDLSNEDTQFSEDL